MFRFLSILLIFIGLAPAQVLVDMSSWGHKGSAGGQFNDPRAVVVSPSGTVYVVDTGNHRIQLFDLQGNYLKSIGGFGFQPDQFDSPRDIWARSVNNIYVSDYYNQRLQRYDRNMNLLSSFSSNPGSDARYAFGEVAGCVVSGQNDLYVLEHDENKVVKFTRTLQGENSFGGFDSGGGELDSPVQIDLWGSDRIVVSDEGQAALLVYDLFGNFMQRIESTDFKRPQGLAVGPAGALYVADPVAAKVFRISKNGRDVTPLATALPLKAPRDVALHRQDGEIFVYILDANQVKSGILRLP